MPLLFLLDIATFLAVVTVTSGTALFEHSDLSLGFHPLDFHVRQLAVVVLLEYG